jgi:hypothetical protein
MSSQGRPKGEFRRAEPEGCLMSRRAVPKPVLSLVEGANTAMRSMEVA